MEYIEYSIDFFVSILVYQWETLNGNKGICVNSRLPMEYIEYSIDFFVSILVYQWETLNGNKGICVNSRLPMGI